MTVLLIDDIFEEHSLFELALKRINVGADYYSASSCNEAIEKITQKEIPLPDYIFLDVAMPEVDGNGCLNMLKAHSFSKDISIVLYTTLDHHDEIIYMLRHGAVSHLDKSRSFEKFCTDLRAILVSEPVK